MGKTTEEIEAIQKLGENRNMQAVLSILHIMEKNNEREMILSEGKKALISIGNPAFSVILDKVDFGVSDGKLNNVLLECLDAIATAEDTKALVQKVDSYTISEVAAKIIAKRGDAAVKVLEKRANTKGWGFAGSDKTLNFAIEILEERAGFGGRESNRLFDLWEALVDTQRTNESAMNFTLVMSKIISFVKDEKAAPRIARILEKLKKAESLADKDEREAIREAISMISKSPIIGLVRDSMSADPAKLEILKRTRKKNAGTSTGRLLLPGFNGR